MYNIVTHKRVDKFLESHPEILQQFFAKLEIMRYDPLNIDKLDIRKLKNNLWYGLRIGKYRFLYTIKDQEIIVYFYNADSRGDIYK